MSDTTLNEAVDELVNRRRILLFKDENGHNVRGDVPSLIEQLEAAVGRDGPSNGTGSSRARPPISVGVAALLIDIGDTAAAAVRERHGHQLHNIADNLRRIAADRAELPVTDEDVKFWIDTLTRWTRRAKAALGTEPKYPQGLRGIRCPNCGADHTTGTNDIGEKVKIPALQFAWSEPVDLTPDQLPEDRRMRAVQCAMCGETWWAGAQLWQLQAQIDAVIRQNLEQETLAQ